MCLVFQLESCRSPRHDLSTEHCSSFMSVWTVRKFCKFPIFGVFVDLLWRACRRERRTHLHQQNVAYLWVPGGGGGRFLALLSGYQWKWGHLLPKNLSVISPFLSWSIQHTKSELKDVSYMWPYNPASTLCSCGNIFVALAFIGTPWVKTRALADSTTHFLAMSEIQRKISWTFGFLSKKTICSATKASVSL